MAAVLLSNLVVGSAGVLLSRSIVWRMLGAVLCSPVLSCKVRNYEVQRLFCTVCCSGRLQSS